MSRIETVLAEIETWNEREIRTLYKALASRLADDGTSLPTLKRLEKYVGIGKGLWKEDAQTHVNQLRQDRPMT